MDRTSRDRIIPAASKLVLGATALALVAACGGGKKEGGEDKAPETMLTNPYPSTYAPYPGQPTLITGVTILDGAGGKIENGAVFFREGKIELIGEAGKINAPERGCPDH